MVYVVTLLFDLPIHLPPSLVSVQGDAKDGSDTEDSAGTPSRRGYFFLSNSTHFTQAHQGFWFGIWVGLVFA